RERIGMWGMQATRAHQARQRAWKRGEEEKGRLHTLYVDASAAQEAYCRHLVADSAAKYLANVLRTRGWPTTGSCWEWCLKVPRPGERRNRSCLGENWTADL